MSGFALLLVGALAAQPAETVDFARDIKPVFMRHCLKCHGGAKRKGGLSIDTRESLVAGGDSGPAVVVGKSSESLLIELVSGHDEARIMPAEGERLSTAQIKSLAAWIDQGLVWPKGFSFTTVKRAPLAPRRPELPRDDATATASNPIDRLLRPYFATHEFDSRQFVDDGVFARRVYLDLVGLLPTPTQVAEFESDTVADKRARLVRRLLDDRDAYATHWLTFWNDALRNAYRGTGFIDGGRQQITGWLYRSLYENKPYDKFVHELISPVSGSEGFTKGLVWRGVVNSSQTPPMQAAQNLSQVFLGTNLKCASCHDSFVNYWKLSDAYSLAAVFADQPLEIHRCDTAGWQHAVEVADAGAAPWGIADKLVATPLGPISSVRSALLSDDALVRALGRPNREQVVTRRESIATTLQALELTNGQTLDDLVARGARQWLKESPAEPAALVVGIYRTALGRAPRKQEAAIAAELLGSPVTPAGLEDFLWAVTMLPEFQLIH